MSKYCESVLRERMYTAGVELCEVRKAPPSHLLHACTNSLAAGRSSDAISGHVGASERIANNHTTICKSACTQLSYITQ